LKIISGNSNFDKSVNNSGLYCKYYEKFKNFVNAIDNSLNKINLEEYQEEFYGLLNLKFQFFEKTQIITN